MLAAGELERMDPVRRESLIRAATQVIARLHRAPISWRSMKAKHFYPEETAPGQWRIWLIDCEGVSRRVTRGDRQREWSQFLGYIAARSPGLREAFLAAYWLALSL
jgi:hypothetical protein